MRTHYRSFFARLMSRIPPISQSDKTLPPVRVETPRIFDVLSAFLQKVSR